MRLPQIRLEQSYAKIGIKTSKSVQEISQPKAELNLKQEPAILEISRTPSKLTIDQTQCWNDMGLKSAFVATRDEADRGHQAALEGIARRAQEGDQMAAIHKGSNPIPDFHNNDIVEEPVEFNVGFIPRYGSLRLDYQPSELDIEVTVRGASMNPVIHMPEHSYTPGRIEMYLTQKNSLKIDYVGLFTDESV